MKTLSVIIDTGSGLDDIAALALAVSSPKIDLQGVTVVKGRRPFEEALKGTLELIEFLDKKISVARGAPGPIRNRDGTVKGKLPEWDGKLHELGAVDFISEVIQKSEMDIHLVTLGPLTNIAIFLLAYPELKHRVKSICVLGGAALGGDFTPTGEYNICQDPEAAHIVFRSGVPIVMCGLDVTRKVRATKEDIERLKRVGSSAMDRIVDIAESLGQGEAAEMNGWPERLLRTAIPVAYLLQPDMFTVKPCHVEVDLDGEYTRGCTVTDLNHVTAKQANADVVLDVDRNAFFELFVETVRQYGK